MNSFRRGIAVTLLALVVAGCASSARRTPADGVAAPAAAISAARAIASALHEENGIPGFAVAVRRDDDLLWSEGFGYADLELRVPATPKQRFRLASVSKLVTAALAARLVDQGRLDLDAPARSFLPDYPEIGAAITARQILGHLSGIRHYQPKDFVDDWDARHFESVKASLVAFQNDPLLSPPGEQEHYSTYAFTLLAAMLEVAGGATFPELVEREVARPLGLATLAVDRRSAIVGGRVAFYDRDDGDPAVLASAYNAKSINPSYKWAGGGLLASAEDLARFGAAHLAPGYLSAETLGALFTPQKTASGTEVAVGLAWRIAKDPAGRTIYHHSGSQEGSRAFLLVVPEERLVLAFLSNLGGVPAKALDHAVALAAPFLDAPRLAQGTR